MGEKGGSFFISIDEAVLFFNVLFLIPFWLYPTIPHVSFKLPNLKFLLLSSVVLRM